MLSPARTFQGVCAAALALALGAATLVPAQAAGALPPSPRISPTVRDLPASATSARLNVVYQGTDLAGVDPDTFATAITTPAGPAASCGGTASRTLISFCVQIPVAAANVADGAATDVGQRITIAAGVVSDAGTASLQGAASIIHTRHGAPGAPTGAAVGTTVAVPTTYTLASTSEAGPIQYELAAPILVPGVTVQGSTLSWDGVIPGTVWVTATDRLGQSRRFGVELVALVPVNLVASPVTTGTASSPVPVVVSASGATSGTTYRTSGGDLTVTDLVTTSAGVTLSVDATRAGTFSTVVEAYETVGGRDIVTGSVPVTVTFVGAPLPEAPRFTIDGVARRPLDQRITLSTDPAVTGVRIVQAGFTWGTVSLGWPTGGSDESFLRVQGSRPPEGSWTMRVALSNAFRTTEVDVDVVVAPAPEPIATITPRTASSDVPASGGKVDFDVAWRESSSATTPANIPGLALVPDFAVTGVVDPELTVTRVAADRWTLSVEGTGWTGADVTVALRAGAVQDVWGVPNRAASGVFPVAVVEAPTVTMPPTVGGVVGTSVSVPLAGSTTAIDQTLTWRVVDAPQWMTLTGNELVGTPFVAGAFPVRLAVRDALGQETVVATSLEIAPAPTAPSFVGSPPATVTVKVGEPVSVVVEADGVPMPSLSVAQALPEGLTFVDDGAGTATLAGAPTEAGTWSLDVVATSTSGRATHTLELTVAPVAAPMVTLAPTVSGVVGAAVSVTLVATTTAADPTLVRTIVDGPDWLTVAGTDLVGTPTEPGSFPVTVEVRDSLGQVAQATTTFEVAPAPEVPAFVGTPPSSLEVRAGRPFSVTFTAAGVPVPVFTVGASEAQVVSGMTGATGRVAAVPGPVVQTAGLPGGVTLTDNGDGTATLAGTPTAAGAWSFDVVASNASGRVAHAVRLVVAEVTPPPSEEPTAAPTTSPADEELPVTGARPLVGLGVAGLLAAAGVVVLAVRRRTA